MPNVNWLKRLVGGLKRLEEEFQENELAYLALSSKAEKPIVDRLAFRLQRTHGSESLAVAREFTESGKIRRVDLAVVADRVPRLLLEAKAMNALNVYRPKLQRRYPGLMRADVNKLRKYPTDDETDQPTKVVLLLTTYTHALPDSRWDGIVKYAALIRKHHQVNDIADLRRRFIQQLPEGEFPLAASGNIRGGCAFDLDVTIHYRLFGPY